jgi:hypothetical protein
MSFASAIAIAALEACFQSARKSRPCGQAGQIGGYFIGNAALAQA